MVAVCHIGAALSQGGNLVRLAQGLAAGQFPFLSPKGLCRQRAKTASFMVQRTLSNHACVFQSLASRALRGSGCSVNLLRLSNTSLALVWFCRSLLIKGIGRPEADKNDKTDYFVINCGLKALHLYYFQTSSGVITFLKMSLNLDWRKHL